MPNTFLRSILHEESSFLHFWYFFTGITPLGVFIFYSHSRTVNKKFPFTNSLYFRDMLLNGISLDSCKKPRNVHFNLNTFFFHFPVKLVLLTYGPFSWSTSQMKISVFSNKDIKVFTVYFYSSNFPI